MFVLFKLGLITKLEYKTSISWTNIDSGKPIKKRSVDEMLGDLAEKYTFLFLFDKKCINIFKVKCAWVCFMQFVLSIYILPEIFQCIFIASGDFYSLAA